MNTIDNATPEQIANMLIAPVVKLYKRCARNHHDTCPGSFESWSICSCQCHAGVSDMRAAYVAEGSTLGAKLMRRAVHDAMSRGAEPIAEMPAPAPTMPVTCADKAEAVAAAVAIVATPKPAKVKAKAQPQGYAFATVNGTYYTLVDDGKNRNSRGGRKVTSPGVKRAPEVECTLANIDRFTSRLEGTLADVLGRCADCRVVMREEYGRIGGMCHACNVKAGVMFYVNRWAYGKDRNTDGIDLEFVLPMTRDTFDAMLAVNSALNPWKEVR